MDKHQQDYPHRQYDQRNPKLDIGQNGAQQASPRGLLALHADASLIGGVTLPLKKIYVSGVVAALSSERWLWLRVRRQHASSSRGICLPPRSDVR
jgi:hypothetical protein